MCGKMATSWGMKRTLHCALHLCARVEHMNNTDAHTTIPFPTSGLPHERPRGTRALYMVKRTPNGWPSKPKRARENIKKSFIFGVVLLDGIRVSHQRLWKPSHPPFWRHLELNKAPYWDTLLKRFLAFRKQQNLGNHNNFVLYPFLRGQCKNAESAVNINTLETRDAHKTF